MARFGADFLQEVLRTAKTPIGQFMGEEGGGKIQGSPSMGGFFPGGQTTAPTFSGGLGSFGGENSFAPIMAAWSQAKAAKAKQAQEAAKAQQPKAPAGPRTDYGQPPQARTGYPMAGYPTSDVPGDVPAAYVDTLREAGQIYGVDPALLAAQIRQESGYNTNARSPAGAQGIAQFIPETAAAYGVDVNDPRSSILGMAHYMADLLRQYGGNQQEALAAYNGGDRAVQRLRAGQPFQETRQYLERVGATYRSYQTQQAQQPQTPSALPSDLPGNEQGRQPIQGVSQNDYARAAGLDRATAAAICGPAAVDAFVRQNGGRTPSVTEAFDIAKRNGHWDQQNGMHGPTATQAVLTQMGVPSTIVPASTPVLAREVTLGHLAIVNTRGHYYQAIGYDPDTDRFQWGDAVGAGRWARLDQLAQWNYGAPDVAIIAASQ